MTYEYEILLDMRVAPEDNGGGISHLWKQGGSEFSIYVWQGPCVSFVYATDLVFYGIVFHLFTPGTSSYVTIMVLNYPDLYIVVNVRRFMATEDNGGGISRLWKKFNAKKEINKRHFVFVTLNETGI
ncbi:hypothetical protein CEXT_775601 [Caerostris extrusa]|uniref:Uncharacterized protein n=1 Tax=Caerostris extrusa TaxID=172846 RepID=A0AAV4R288_CAEEX|nr:hypothetical protein CEXT_775601 [Caerostris extrusa]